MKYLLDTNVLSEAVKLVPDRSVLEMMGKHRDEIVTAPCGMNFNMGVTAFRVPVSVRLSNHISAACQIGIW
ncbi:hypothetical protein QUF80_16215 [Desulfococcaceae bacterium HSG8]|nr:hypothetical protein [Desulfococcaceae bacterium HSG8]